ncbi:MAG: DnaJ domain-containing protein [Bacteroidia bacterium]
MKDYYYILGLTNKSTDEQIKSAYRKLSVKFHPDKNDGDKFFEERFKDIQEAYETLSNPSKKASYNLKFQSGKGASNNNESFKNYEEQLKRKYDEELRKKEAEIKQKYQTPEQRQDELNEIRRRAEENRIKKEKEDALKAIEENKILLTKKEQERAALLNRINILNTEIPAIKQTIENSYTKSNSSAQSKTTIDSWATILAVVILIVIIWYFFVQFQNYVYSK